MHGGAKGSGAPPGTANGAYRTGEFTKDALAAQRKLRALLAVCRSTLDDIE
jgi:hypothetical protein